MALVGLVLVCAGVLWLRTRHLDYLLPHLPEPDLYSVVQVDHLRAKAAGSEAQAPFQFYFYPMLLARLHLALPEPPPPATPAPGEDVLVAHLERAGATLERSRTIVAWLSVLAVPATFAIALAFTRPWIALLAAALAGTSFLHLVFSGQARPHGIAAAFVAVAIAAAIGIRRRPTPWTYALAGVAGMLALCSLQNGSAALLALGAAHLLRDRARDRGGWKKLLPPVAVIAGGVLFFYAFFVEKAPAEMATQSYTSPRVEDGVLKYGGHEIDLKLFRGQGFPKLDDFLRWNDPLLLWAGALGLVFALGHLARKRGRLGATRARDLGVLLAHALPYTFMLGLFAKTFERYLLPLLPVLALLSAVGIAGAAALVTRPLARRAGWRAGVAAALAVAPLAWPVSNAWQLVRLRGTPDTQEVAAAWLRERVAPDERVVTGPGTILPTFYAPDALPALGPQRLHVQWLRYQKAWSGRWPQEPGLEIVDAFIREIGIPDATEAALREPESALAWFDAQEADWFVLENSQRMRTTLSKKGFDLLRQAAFARGKRVLDLRPHPKRRFPYEDYQDAERAVSRAWSAERLGPEIEVWKLNRP